MDLSIQEAAFKHLFACNCSQTQKELGVNKPLRNQKLYLQTVLILLTLIRDETKIQTVLPVVMQKTTINIQCNL